MKDNLKNYIGSVRKNSVQLQWNDITNINYKLKQEEEEEEEDEIMYQMFY